MCVWDLIPMLASYIVTTNLTVSPGGYLIQILSRVLGVANWPRFGCLELPELPRGTWRCLLLPGRNTYLPSLAIMYLVAQYARESTL
jgi:hypothetical protein